MENYIIACVLFACFLFGLQSFFFGLQKGVKVQHESINKIISSTLACNRYMRFLESTHEHEINEIVERSAKINKIAIEALKCIERSFNGDESKIAKIALEDIDAIIADDLKNNSPAKVASK